MPKIRFKKDFGDGFKLYTEIELGSNLKVEQVTNGWKETEKSTEELENAGFQLDSQAIYSNDFKISWEENNGDKD